MRGHAATGGKDGVQSLSGGRGSGEWQRQRSQVGPLLSEVTVSLSVHSAQLACTQYSMLLNNEYTELPGQLSHRQLEGST